MTARALPAAARPLPANPRPGDPLPADPRPGDPLPADPRPGNALPADLWPGDPRPADSLPADPLAGELAGVFREPTAAEWAAAPTDEELWGDDPEYGPPLGLDAALAGWPADLPAGAPAGLGTVLADPPAHRPAGAPPPADLLSEQLGTAALAARLPAQERVGILAPPDPHGAGFALGGAADELAPGVVLAGLAEHAWQRQGLLHLSDDALIGLLRAFRRLGSWACAGEAAAITELDHRRRAQVAAGADPQLAEHLPEEIAPPLTLTPRGAGLLYDFACALASLPATMAALADGRIDRAKAHVITSELTGLSTPQAAAVEAKVLGRAPAQTTGELRATLRRAVLAVDPAAARARRQQAQQQARVEVWDEPAGTAGLAGRDLPPASVIAADQHLNALARHLKKIGADGTLSQLRARAYLTLLLGAPVDSLLPEPGTAPARHPGTPKTTIGHGATTRPDAAANPPGDPGTTASPQAAAGPRGTASPQAAAMPSSTPPSSTAPSGTAPSGTAPSGTAPSGTAPSGTAPSGTPPGRAASGGATPSSVTPGGPVLTGSVNLTMPLATWLDGATGAGEVPGYGPISAEDAQYLARRLASAPRTRWCITLTGPDGRAVGHGCARYRYRPATAGPGQAPDWELTVTIKPLATGDCPHWRQVPGYRPSAGLAHILTIRQPSCSYPGCRRPASQCDLDHTTAHHLGGKTCECNLAPLCRRHHQAKQAQGWRLTQPAPGTLAWQLPHGRTYTTRASPYPPAVEPPTAEIPTGQASAANRPAAATPPVHAPPVHARTRDTPGDTPAEPDPGP